MNRRSPSQRARDASRSRDAGLAALLARGPAAARATAGGRRETIQLPPPGLHAPAVSPAEAVLGPCRSCPRIRACPNIVACCGGRVDYIPRTPCPEGLRP